MPYKIVEKGTRWGLNWLIFKYYRKTQRPEIYVRGVAFRKSHPEFFPRYFKDRIIHAVPGSLGIMCFPFKEDAEQFKLLVPDTGKIIKVEGIGKPRHVYEVLPTELTPWNLTADCEIYGPAPEGTIGYSAVRVLE